MTLSRRQFFIILFLLLAAPFTFYKLLWLATSSAAKGTVSFTGHGNLGSALGMSSYPVIKFFTGTDTIFFNGNADLHLKDGEQVNIRFQQSNPTDAKINSFITMWGDTLAYSLGPLLVFAALFFIPDVFPKNTVVRFSKKPVISLIPSVRK